MPTNHKIMHGWWCSGANNTITEGDKFKVHGFKHINPILTRGAERLLERMFNKGYKFVHVEI